MSEAERKRREEYRKRRKRWLVAQAIVLAIITLVLGAVSFAYVRLNETTYVTYTETSAVDYQVKLKENEFYEEEWLGKDQAYVASLIDGVSADFSYELAMDAENVNYEYSYKIETVLKIVHDDTNGVIFSPAETVYESEKAASVENKLAVSQNVFIDYAKYNDLAVRFNEAYGLIGVTSELIVRMNVTVVGSCAKFEENTLNNYVVALHMPLTEKAITIQMQSSVPVGESKVLACSEAFNDKAFKGTIFSLAGADGLLLIVFVCFIFLTRNEDINYANKVRKLLSDYRSFIQRINNGFDTTGYQLLEVDTFNEMLAIRDTIQSPVLMSENLDKTRTLFLIPTNTKILYIYEIKVDNYDELYGDRKTEGAAILSDEIAAAKAEAAVEETVAAAEESVVEEAVAEEVIEEAPAEEEIAAEETQETAKEEPMVEVKVVSPEELEEFDGDDEEEESDRFGVRWNYSFEAKLALSTEEIKGYYCRIAEYALSYGVKLSRSWKRERIHKGRKLFAALAFRGKKLVIALALDPKTAHPKYHAKDMSEVKKYEKTPMLMRVTSERKVKYAVELLKGLFEGAGLKDKALAVTVAPTPYRSKKKLVIEGLIKTTANLDELEDDTPAAPVAEAPVEETPVSAADELPVDIDDIPDTEEGFAAKFGRGLDYSMEARIALANDEARAYYKQITEFVLSYGVKCTRSWKRERIYLGRNLFALIGFKGTKLFVAFAIDPKTADPKYHAKDVSDVKKYEKTPMQMMVTSERKLKYAIELLEELFKAEGLEHKSLPVKTKTVQKATRNSLMKKGLIRFK